MKNGRKAVGLLLAAVLAMSAMTGCAAGKKDETKTALEQIQEAGKIKIAMEGTWAPWTYHDEADALVGYDTEVGRAIAAKLGVEAEFYEGEWDGLFAGLDGGRYDVIINGVEITETRKQTYDFSDPYAYAKTVIIVREDDDRIQTFEDLSGKKTCNSMDSTYMNLAEHYGATVMGVDSLEQTISMVLNGQVDATLNSLDSYAYYLSMFPDAKLKIAATYDIVSEVAIPFKKGASYESLRKAVNDAIAALRADGTLKALSEKYFGSDITVK